MSEPFLAEIRITAFNFAPQGWAFCNGQVLPISQNQALFAILGTTYGGNGVNTFALPDLRSRAPIHAGNGFVLGQVGGQESVTLTVPQLPNHTHPVSASTNAVNARTPVGGTWGTLATNSYGTALPDVAMNPANVTATGGNQPHENRQPMLALNFIIALQGIFPSRN